MTPLSPGPGPAPSPEWPALPGYAHEWALVDVETSGLSPSRDRVLSLAIVTLDERGSQTGEFTTLLDPGCDPGPVHVHGLTRARLAGSPTFDAIAPQVAELLAGRVMVAHNAHFDYGFLAHEFARTAADPLPVANRLCTLALNRLVAPATPDLKLAALAAHYGVRQLRAHDALDDVRVLAGILRGSLTAAARLGLALPVLPCPPRQVPRQERRSRAPKAPCPYRNPGRLAPGGPLVQGMKVAITGATRTPRAELTARSTAAGLEVMAYVSAQTSVLVTNDPATASGKLRRAASSGVPLVDEQTYVRLLADVRPGEPHSTPSDRARPAPAPKSPPPAADRPLAGRRVLVLGGTHEEASAARARVVALGASAAVNLSSGVTDVVLLAGGTSDRRMSRVTALALPTHEATWLQAPAPAPSSPQSPASASVLVRGAVIDLPDTATPWTVSATWAQATTCPVDVVAFALDAGQQVTADEDFVFYNAPEHPDGTVRLTADSLTDQSVTVDLDRLPPHIARVVVAAAIDGDTTFADVGPIEITATQDPAAPPTVRATLDAATTERTLILTDLYRRAPAWRLRAVGQGYDHPLRTLAESYGVAVTD
jgi:DNA polymerase-3 subunit epsilon